MKRDMELIRKLLLYIEETEQPMSGGIGDIEADGYSRDTINAHLKLMDDRGFFDEFHIFIGKSHMVKGLTNEAHDFIELIRNDGIWEETNKVIEEKNIPKTMENIAVVAGKFVGAALNQILDR